MEYCQEELGLPPDYPSSTDLPLQLFSSTLRKQDGGVSFHDRIKTAVKQSDALRMRTYHEIHRKFCDYLAKQFRKHVLCSGHFLPEPVKQAESLFEDRWDKWLNKFKRGSVISCTFGSQMILKKSQFQELALGMELTGYPFLEILKLPSGATTVQEALPEGFEESVKDRGVVCGGWIQQPEILRHPSVGCFVSHCGFGSMWESLLSDCQRVFVPNLLDQMLSTRLFVG